MIRNEIHLLRGALVLTLAVVVVGCGYIADKGLIRIAKLRGEYITRDDLRHILRDMPDDDRPRIETKGDVLRALEKAIDDKIKAALAKDLKAGGKIHVPREIAERFFLAQNPDFMIDIQNPEDYGLVADARIIKEEREAMIDKVQDKLLAEAAVGYRIQEAVKLGALTITDEEYQREFTLRQFELLTAEVLTFEGIWFDKAAPNANQDAAKIRARMDAGEKSEDIAKEFPPDRLISATIGYEPNNQKFRAFWNSAAGSAKGAKVGPVVIIQPEMSIQNAQGELAAHQLPTLYLVCEITNAVPPRQMTLEEAKPRLAPGIYYVKMMQILYKEFGREIYEDSLEDPSMFERRTIGPMARGDVLIRLLMG